MCFIKIVISYLVLGKMNLDHSVLKFMLLQLKLTGDQEEDFTALPSSTKCFLGGRVLGRDVAETAEPLGPLNP